ncbi:hypothetical protein [Nocardiopsis sp. CA-288880]|uniref:hypothetical protein n=1 Tax=Nocardiopsis sp. CA-288880 TaxID=3239995 RepID=UPI003D9913BF
MAQDFHAAFGLGQSETTIPVVDSSGVALVSIQALHKLVQELDDEVTALRAEVRALRAPTA